MPRERIIVLKFGGSVLREPKDVHRAVQEIYRWRRGGFQVIAVVSAIGNTTDEFPHTKTKFPGKETRLRPSSAINTIHARLPNPSGT